MPVTVHPAQHAARKVVAGHQTQAQTAQDLLRASCPSHCQKPKSILQSSFDDLHELESDNPTFGSKNGFVHTAINAYRQKKLEVLTVGNKDTADFGKILQHMTSLVSTHLNDPELLSWIMPDFTTTTEDDKVVAAILMMGAMQKDFSLGVGLSCGLPSVTLLREREDWEKILARLEKIDQLGAEAVQFATLLKPIINNFIASFNTLGCQRVISFWNKITRKTGGSHPPILSGWITAFCLRDQKGKSLYAPEGREPKGKMNLESRDTRRPGCDLDGTLYQRLSTEHIPVGYASVPINVDDNGKKSEATMLAGSVGTQVTSSGNFLDDGSDSRRSAGRPDLDSLQPLSGWWMYEQ